MKFAGLAMGLAFVAAIASAQAPESPKPADVPKPKCEPKPEFPGRLGLQLDSKRKAFERDMKAYQECMKAYIEERKAIIKANEAAASAAVEEYNGLMTKIRTEQEAARQQ
jgi:hypothetical protein